MNATAPYDRIPSKLKICGGCGISLEDQYNYCIKPMENFLLAFKKIINAAPEEQKEFTISTDTEELITAVDIADISDLMLTTIDEDNDRTLIVPICQIIGIQSPLVDQVPLEPPSFTNSGPCAYCEGPISRRLANIKKSGKLIDTTSGYHSFYDMDSVKIINIGKGIVTFYEDDSTKYAVLISRIDYIEIQ